MRVRVIRIKQYFLVQDYALWEVIKNGNSCVSVPQTAQKNGTYVTKMSAPVIAKEKTNKKNDVKARSLLLMALPNEHKLTFSQYNDAKTMLQKIISRLSILGVVIVQEDLNSKFLSSLPPEWYTYVVVWMNKAEIETMSIDDLYNNFKIVKQSVKKYVAASSGAQNLAFMFAHSTSTTNDVNTAKPAYEDLEKIHKDDLEEIDLKWQLSLLSMRAKRECRVPRNKEGQFRNQDNTRKHGNNEDTSSKAMLAIDGIAATYKRGLATVEEQLITYRKNEVLFSEEVAVLKREVACKDYEINVLKSEFEKITDKSKKGLGYNVVPPPHPLIYNRPKKLDLSYSGLDEFKEPEFKGYGSENSKQESNIVCDKKSDASKENSDDSLVKEQVSEDTSSFVESPLNVDKETVFLDKKIDIVKPKNHEKLVKKSVRYAEMYRSKRPWGNQRNWNGQKSNQLGSDFVMYNKACFICGSFNHVQAQCKYHQRERMVYGNNYQRVNYNYNTNRTQPNAQRNMVARAVLMKTGLKSFNTIRTVNIAHPRSTVYSAKPMSFNAVKVKVNTVRQKAVKNARQNSVVVNVVRGKPQQDDTRFINSGCSRHMTGNIAYLMLHLGEEHMVVEFLMCDKKNYVLFTDTECLVLSPNFKLPDESQILFKIPRKDNMYSFDMKNIVPKESLTCLVAKATSDESMLWHRRLGHINFNNINKLVKDNLIRGLATKRFENDQTCVVCLKWKQHRASCKSKVLNPITKSLFMLYMDLFSPTFVSSLMHKKYCFVVSDDYSRHVKRGRDTKISQSSGPPVKVGDEAVHKELGDKMERAATIASSLEAELDSDAQTRFETTSKQSNDPPVSRVNTLGSGEDSLKLIKLMAHCTTLSALNALTECPTLYASPIEHFWQTTALSTDEDGVRGLTATIDRKVKVFVSKASIRRHLKLEDFEGLKTLLTAKNFEQLALMGREEGSLSLNELMDLCTSLSKKVASLESELKQTKQTYHAALTKLIKRVKKLENTIKIIQARRRAKVVISDAEEDEEDPSNQGRSLIKELDLDAGISLRRREVSTGSGGVSTASRLVSAADVSTTSDLESTTGVKAKDKGKAIMHESEPPKKIKKKEARFKAEQERIDFETALELQKKLDEREEVTAKVDQAHDIDWSDPSLLRYHTLQNRPYSVAEVRKNMCLYLKDQGGFKMSHFKGVSYEDIRPIFERVWDQNQAFIPMVEEEIVQQDDVIAEQAMKESSRTTGGRRKKSLARKRARETLSEESAKKQKLEDDTEKEELQVYLNIVPEEESFNIESLATKYPIVDWETQNLANDKYYYQIKRADVSVKHYKIFSAMHYDFDRQDVLTMMEPNGEDEILRNQQDWNLINWKLHNFCGVHVLLMDTCFVIHMIVEKKYPLS
ncbi:putative ribonuclease H-like domain-containing protein [Tanacetum coccineum]